MACSFKIWGTFGEQLSQKAPYGRAVLRERDRYFYALRRSKTSVSASDAAAFASPAAHRAAYQHYLERRLACASRIIDSVREARHAG